MKTILMGAVALFFTVNASAQSIDATAERNTTKYNPPHVELGLLGMDPVSFYSEAGPVKGTSAVSLVFQGVLYNFATEANKEIFLVNPNKYEPTYGGWCAWAMSQGSRAPIDPKFYVFDYDDAGNRVRINFYINAAAMGNHYGFGRRDRKTSLEIIALMEAGDDSALENGAKFTAQADEVWKGLSNEDPKYSNGLN